MILSKINLRNELRREQNRQKLLLGQVYEFLNTGEENDLDVINRLKSKPNESSLIINIDDNDLNRTFSIETIKTICIRFRLRFLDTSFLRSDYPYSAIAEINTFEKKYGIKIKSFRVIAPSKAFDLENINKDPLLFAQLDDNSFYLLHQWGNDLAWYRKILAWPLQSFKTLMLSLAILCFLFAFSLPTSILNIFNFESQIYLRLWLSVHTFIGSLGLCLWAGLSFDKTFSNLNWDSKYYNY